MHNLVWMGGLEVFHAWSQKAQAMLVWVGTTRQQTLTFGRVCVCVPEINSRKNEVEHLVEGAFQGDTLPDFELFSGSHIIFVKHGSLLSSNCLTWVPLGRLRFPEP